MYQQNARSLYWELLCSFPASNSLSVYCKISQIRNRNHHLKSTRDGNLNVKHELVTWGNLYGIHDLQISLEFVFKMKSSIHLTQFNAQLSSSLRLTVCHLLLE